MFVKASLELKGNNPEMIPFWWLPLNDERFKDIDTEKIERIVPMYPMSEDVAKYNRLIKVLSLYRLTMGQLRQEELLQMLEGKVNKNKINKLLFDLCPFNRNKNMSLKSATKPFNVLLACTRPLITEFSYKLRLKCPLLPTISPYPKMRLETKPVLEPHVKLGGITAPKVKHV